MRWGSQRKKTRHPGSCLCFNKCWLYFLSPRLLTSLFSSLLYHFLCPVSHPICHPFISVSDHFYCSPSLHFSCSHFILRDKAPGQRECDSSIDNINKCIRDIEQASLAAVSQNLPSRDDISLEVSNHQKITCCFPQTTMATFLYLHFSLFVYPCFLIHPDVSFIYLFSSVTYFCLSFSDPCVSCLVSLYLWIYWWP